jgi:hypothetical protein
MAVRADVTVSRAAAAAVAAAEHRVTGDAGAVPGFVDTAANRRNDTAPLVAGAQRETGLPLLEVGQLAGEQFKISAADPDAMNVHDDLTRGGNGGRDFGHPC